MLIKHELTLAIQDLEGQQLRLWQHHGPMHRLHLALYTACKSVNLIPCAAPPARQSNDAALFQQVAQVTGRGGFGYLGHGLVLSRTDSVLESPFAAIKQAVKHFDLLRR